MVRFLLDVPKEDGVKPLGHRLLHTCSARVPEVGRPGILPDPLLPEETEVNFLRVSL
jgi:hypothetical protein